MKPLKIEMLAIDKIKPYEQNVKKHTPEQVAGIVKSLELGWDQPIVVDENYVIIKGHGRRLAAIELKMTKVPVLVRVDLTPDQVRVARLADNHVALGGIDTDMFRKEIADLETSLLTTFYTPKELQFAVADLGEINLDGFVPDLDAAMVAQEAESKAAGADALKRRVSITKVFGYKDVAGASELYLTRFIARMEAETGLTGEQAFVAFIKSLKDKAPA